MFKSKSPWKQNLTGMGFEDYSWQDILLFLLNVGWKYKPSPTPWRCKASLWSWINASLQIWFECVLGNRGGECHRHRCLCHLSEVTKCLLGAESISFVLVAIDCHHFWDAVSWTAFPAHRFFQGAFENAGEQKGHGTTLVLPQNFLATWKKLCDFPGLGLLTFLAVSLPASFGLFAWLRYCVICENWKSGLDSEQTGLLKHFRIIDCGSPHLPLSTSEIWGFFDSAR